MARELPASSLTSDKLRAIADALDGLAQVSFTRVSTIEVQGLRVELKFNDSQRDGAWYAVTGIEGVVFSGTRDTNVFNV